MIFELSSSESTSAAGAMLMRQVRGPILVGCMLVGLSTSTAYALPQDQMFWPQHSVEQTTAGAAVLTSRPASAGIGELRRLSGLTWDQLARVFNVSRRSLHFWASGKPMAASNEEHLQRVLAIVRKIDRGSASANRTALLGIRDGDNIPFDFLIAGNYERVLALLGPGEAQRTSLPKVARGVRASRPPEELVGALQDRIHRESGAFRTARSVRVRSGR